MRSLLSMISILMLHHTFLSDLETFPSNEFYNFTGRETPSMDYSTTNGQTYYNCDECPDFNTASQRLLQEHIKYCHSSYRNHTGVELTNGFSHLDDETQNIYEAIEMRGLMDLKTENVHLADSCEDFMSIKIKQEWLDSFEESDLVTDFGNNLIVHKDVFECKICDEFFVCRNKYMNHLGSKLHIFNEISKNSVSHTNHSNCNSDDEEGYIKFDDGQSQNDKTVFLNGLGMCSTSSIKKENMKEPKKNPKISSGYVDNVRIKNEPYEGTICDICNYQAIDRKCLVAHAKRAHPAQVHSCEKCSFQCEVKLSLYDHYSTMHKGEPFSCKHCDKTFTALRTYERHLSDHRYTKCCDVCGVTLVGKKEVYSHYFNEHKGFEFKCKQCPFVTNRPKAFIVHEGTAHFNRNCQLCGYVASSKAMLRKHRRRMHASKKRKVQSVQKERIAPPITRETPREMRSRIIADNYKCNICNSFFKTDVLLDTHMKESHHFPCDQCNHVSHSMKQSTSHKLSHRNQNYKPKSNSELCPFCSRRIIHDFNKHIALQHLGDKPYICPTCKEQFASYGEMISHSNDAHSELKHKCDKCPRRYHDLRTLLKHSRKVHRFETKRESVQKNERGRKIPCTRCSYWTRVPKQMERHMLLHSLKRKHACPTCLKRFETRSYLTIHMKRMICDNSVSTSQPNLNIEPLRLENNSDFSEKVSKSVQSSNSWEFEKGTDWSCAKCGRVFDSFRSLKIHAGYHNLKRRIVCKQCGFRFQTTDQLESHEGTFHSSASILVCEKCNQGFTRKDSYYRHMQTHRTQPSVMSTLDDYKSTSKSSLVTHEMVQADEVKYTCEVCDFKCESQILLSQHLKEHNQSNSKKKGSLPSSDARFLWVKCPTCSLQFKTSSPMEQHSREVHFKEADIFICVCGRKFSSGKALNSHVNNHNKLGHSATSVQSILRMSPVIMLSPLKLDCPTQSSNTSQSNLLPFKCFTCRKAFLQIRRLKSHLNTVHNSNTFHCSECDFVSSRINDLASHMYSHPSFLKCSKCFVKFNTYKSKVTHIKRSCGRNIPDINSKKWKPITLSILKSKIKNRSTAKRF